MILAESRAEALAPARIQTSSLVEALVAPLHHGSHDARALPLLRTIPRQIGTRLLGLRSIAGRAASDEEEGDCQKKTIQQSLGR